MPLPSARAPLPSRLSLVTTTGLYTVVKYLPIIRNQAGDCSSFVNVPGDRRTLAFAGPRDSSYPLTRVTSSACRSEGGHLDNFAAEARFFGGEGKQVTLQRDAGRRERRCLAAQNPYEI